MIVVCLFIYLYFYYIIIYLFTVWFLEPYRVLARVGYGARVRSARVVVIAVCRSCALHALAPKAFAAQALGIRATASVDRFAVLAHRVIGVGGVAKLGGRVAPQPRCQARLEGGGTAQRFYLKADTEAQRGRSREPWTFSPIDPTPGRTTHLFWNRSALSRQTGVLSGLPSMIGGQPWSELGGALALLYPDRLQSCGRRAGRGGECVDSGPIRALAGKAGRGGEC